MTLSACIMACDEEATIERCLRSVRPFVDEVCFLDTGSTDGTLEIARRYADHIEQADWEGFGVSRNRSFRMASGDFILIIDSDEWIDETEGWADLRKYLQNQEALAAVQMLLVNHLGEEIIHRYLRERVFLNHPMLEWTGSIQAQTTMPPGNIDSYPATIHHDGYDRPKEELRERYINRLHWYWTEFRGELTPQKRAYYNYHYAVCLYLAGSLGDLGILAEVLDVLGSITMANLSNVYRLEALHLNVKTFLAIHEQGCSMPETDSIYAAMNLAKYAQTEPLMLFHAGSLLALCGHTDVALMLYHKAEQDAARVLEGRRYEMPIEPIRKARRELEHRRHEFRTFHKPITEMP